MGGRWRVTCGDWLVEARRWSGVDLLYVDPPFNTGRRRTSPPRGASLGRLGDAAYPDAWPGVSAYIDWLRTRLEATLPALAPTASVLLHVDQRWSHHVRLMLDDVLGARCFVNHIVWHYGLGGSSRRAFARKHDDIYFYALRPGGHYFDPPMIPARSRRLAGRSKKATDVLDIPAVNNMAHERTGYPTQKPIALLSLLVRACCPPGGLVGDPCCGSGTTLVAAVAEGRRAVGCDTNPRAVEVARARLRALGRTPGP